MYMLLPLLLLVQGAMGTIWVPGAFPNPEANAKPCRIQGSSRICDPDGILKPDEKKALADSITVFEETHSVSCGSVKTNHPEDNELFGIQVGVALVHKMDLYDYRNYEDKENRAAQDFAMHLHNTWGVGEDSPCGGTGILLFLSMDDRAIYISTGNAVKPLLTDYRLDQVMSEMKPLLRQVKYYEALQTAINAMARHVESGKPERMERFSAALSETWPFIMFASINLFFIGQGRLQQRRQREYARVQTQLSELDRRRAEALQGRYNCTSCPICLNDFEGCSEGQETTETPTIGSDGLPLKLLRCGHVFDQSCWTEWIENGQGNFSQCPCCNQNVGAPTEDEGQQSPEQNADDVRQRGGLQDAEPRALRRYNEDRMFRLVRMSMQFPRFINQQQVQRWSDPSYDQSLARDYGFTRRNPSVQHTKYSGGSNRFSSSSRGFGGGGSSGGRGSRW